MAALDSSRVYIDVTRLVQRLRKGRIPTGVDRVCLAYVTHYQSLARAMMFLHGMAVGFSPTASKTLFDWLQDPSSISRKALTGKILQKLRKIPFHRIPSRSWVWNMGHSGLHSPSYAAWLKRKKIRLLVMVHDLIPITHPQFCQPQATQQHHQRMQVILGQSTGIVCNSTHTAQELQDYAQSIHHSMPPMAVLPLGVTPVATAATTLRPTGGKDPYFVILGTLEPRKNHLFLLHLWQQMIKEWPEGTVPQLYIFGQIGWMCEDVLKELTTNPILQEYVHFFPDASDALVQDTLQGAQALLFASHTEGYGLPLLEALAMGVPVLANPLPVFREIAQDVPEYLDIADMDAWLDGIRDFSDSRHPRRILQLDRIRSFVVPTWQNHFEQLHNFMSSL